MSDQAPEVGDKVSWKWGRGNPAGTVTEVRDSGALEQRTQRGKTVKKNADADNPAVRVGERAGGQPVVKRASELTVDERAADRGAGGAPEPHEVTREGKEVRKGVGKGR